MTILVTGGCGFIGSNFIHHLKKITSENHLDLNQKLDYMKDCNLSVFDV